MAAQTNLLTFPGKIEFTEVHIGTGIKTENFDDSSSSVEEPSVSNADISDWDLVFGDGAKPDSPERSGGSPSHEDEVTDLSSIDESPVQPIVQNFPVSVISGKTRRFTAYWYSKYGSWLEYSVEKDAIFCKVCRHFGNNQIADKFIRGFRNWKRTHMACSKHELSKAHNTAMCKYMNYKESQQSSLETRLNQHGNHQTLTPRLIQNNRDHMKVILDIVMFCVRQQIAPIKNTENEPDNFHELFQLLCKYNPTIKSQFDAILKNKSLTAADQDLLNDLIDAAASLLLRQIKQELHNTQRTFYAILADECSDRSKRQLVAVSLRYLYKESIRERVVGFVETGDVSAEGITLKILQILEPFELDPGLCVGFGFDGASVLSEVHSVLKCTYTLAQVVHRRSHHLSSVLCAASKRCPEFRMFFEAVKALCLFLTHKSYGQARFHEIQKEMYPDQTPVELDCGAQAQHHQQHVTAIFSLFDAVLETLAEFAERGGQSGLEAQSLLQQVQTKKFAFLLVASCKLFKVSEVASGGLQNETLSLTECISSVQCLKQNLADLRYGGFEQIFTASSELTGKNEIRNWDVSFCRKRKLQRRDNLVVALSSRVRCADDLRAIWHQILDSQINEVNSRFHRDSFCLMKAAAALCTKDGTNLAENIHPVCESYNIKISDPELFTFSQMLQQTASSGACLSLMEVLDMCSKENFPNLCVVLRILLTLPVTVCTEERICSSVNKIKSASRSTMLTAQLNPLSLLSFEKDLTDSLDYDEIIDIFYFIKFIKPFISQGGKMESVSQLSLTWEPMIPS